MTAAALSKAYARRAFAFYRRTHVERGVAMALKAAGLAPHGRLNGWLTGLGCWFLGSAQPPARRGRCLSQGFPGLFQTHSGQIPVVTTKLLI